MEVKIGVVHANRDIVLESPQSAEEVTAAVATAVAEGSLLSLVDDKGRTVIVPGSQISSVEIGSSERGKVGFGG